MHLPERFNNFTTGIRRSYVSLYAPGPSTNFATHALFNASTGDSVVLLRGYTVTLPSGAGYMRFYRVQGTVGAHLGLEHPVWAGERQPNGQHWYLDSATQAAADESLGVPTTQTAIRMNTTPLAVLPPGWSGVFQANAIAQTLILTWYWEEMYADDPQLGVHFSG